jgi:hypothetical protein
MILLFFHDFPFLICHLKGGGVITALLASLRDNAKKVKNHCNRRREMPTNMHQFNDTSSTETY